MIKSQIVRHWIPTVFCALVVYQYVGGGSGSTDNWRYISIWLTMCFFFVGAVTYSMQKKIQNLEAELQQLREPKKEAIENA
ncbi:hypothetical protein [Undibacterium terreum]|uniref:Uncharacterized protein n=1 Tax=Undibacterium terreum TaxID=1224302 RepID=A0A916UA94_9BURK|nr:hypothetical protein [Undibacterium terreum]GGC65162.1 hypothetical protein GCM10011396_10200 [Undibacterium terreum]